MTFICIFVKYFSGIFEWRGAKFKFYPIVVNRKLAVDSGLVSDLGSLGTCRKRGFLKASGNLT